MVLAGLKRALAAAFATHDASGTPRADLRIVLAFLAVNGLVMTNAVLHLPEVGYDASEHLVHVEALSELRLATRQDTSTFFYPPLPYLLPALFKLVTGASLHAAGKFAQVINVLLSLGVTTLLLLTCRLVGRAPLLRLGTLLTLGAVPVYYRTFAYVRGEPYVVFFATLALYLLVRTFVRGRPTTGGAVALGVALGLAGLARQWGLFLLPAVFAFGLLHLVLHRRRRAAAARALLVALAIGGVVGLVWVGLLRARHGSATSFNRRPAPCFSFKNQPPTFYRGLGDGRLFADPLRPRFANQLLPVLYSELWGDYWAHFLVYAIDTRGPEYIPVRHVPTLFARAELPPWLVTNYAEVGPELGRANTVGLVPSALALAALVAAAWTLVAPSSERRRRELAAFALSVLVASLAGYLWFLIMFPSPGRGDTIKATYMLHLLPFVAVLAGAFFERVQRSMPWVARALLVLLVLAALHNTGMMLTRCTAARLAAVEAG